MSYIATNVDSLIALHNLDRTDRLLGISQQRLSTGVRINSGRDDPGGLVAGELLLQEIRQIEAALRNNARSNSLIGTADAAVGEVASLLSLIQGAITTIANDATLSQAEKMAQQNLVDAALQSIDRIALTTEFGGRKLLDSTLDFKTSLQTGVAAITATSTVTNASAAGPGMPNGSMFTVTDSLGNVVNVVVQNAGGIPPVAPPDRGIRRGVEFPAGDEPAAAAAIAGAVNAAVAAGDLVGVVATSAGPDVIVSIAGGGMVSDTAPGIAPPVTVVTFVSGLGLTENARIYELPAFVDAADPFTFEVRLNVTFEQAMIDLSANLTPGVGFENQTVEIQVQGNRGATVIRLATDGAGAITTGQLDEAVNQVSDITGVSSAGGILRSIEFGSAEFVVLMHASGVNILGPTPATSPATVSDNGVDAGGTINGIPFVGVGRRAILQTNHIDVEFTFARQATPDSITTFFGGSVNFQVEFGGALFQVGQEVNENDQAQIGIHSVHSGYLGNSEVGRLASIGTGGGNQLLDPSNLASAARLVELVTNQVARLQARLGAFAADRIEPTVDRLQVAKEQISAARSVLVNTDYAAETANLTRLQILHQSGSSVLAIANTRPQAILTLLG